MRNITLKIAYDGTNYHGFQRQKNAVAIQNIIEEKLEIIFNENITLAAAGRTDTGVHALGQVVNFFASNNIPTDKIPLALNSLLPNDITVIKALEMPKDFSARFSAKRKTYLYKIQNGNFQNPIMANYAWHIKNELDIELIKEGLNLLKGEHDFSSFQATYKNNADKKKSPVRTLYDVDLRVKRESFWGNIIEIRFCGNGFLYHQVRNMIGALAALGSGKIDFERFKEIFNAKNRNLAPPTAPACGLYLVEVEYGEFTS